MASSFRLSCVHSGALRHGIQFSRKNYARGGHMTRIYVSGRGVTYIHNDTSTSARLLSSTKRCIEFAEVKNDENELEVWRPWMFFGGTDTKLMEEREFLLDVRFTQLNVAPSYVRYTCYGVLYERRYRYQLLLDSFIQTTTRVLYVPSEAAIADGLHLRILQSL